MRLAAAFLGGVLLAATLPPWGWWPLGLAGAAVLAVCLRGQPLRRRALVGLVAGLGLYLPGLWWMHEFTIPGYVLATPVEAGFLALAAALVPPTRGGVWALGPALAGCEWARGHWPFGGVPLGGIALGQAGGPLAHPARIGTQLLVVALVGLAGSALASLVSASWPPRHARGRPPRVARWQRAWGLLGLVAVVGLAVAGALAPDGRPAGHLRVAAAQGGGKRGVRAVKSDPQLVFDRQIEASLQAAPPVDLLLWPEDVIDVARLRGSEAERAVGDLARHLGTTVVAGIVEDSGSDHFRNAAVVWAPDGAVVARYDKVHRVPFGEYIPARALIRHLADLSSVPRDERSGHGPGRLDTPVGRLAVVVSYEVFFGDRARSGIRAGGTLLLVPTNASSFRASQVPGQELAAARLRAIEGGRWVVQAAPTGYTAVVDQRGRVRARTHLGPAATLQRTVGLRRGRTIATRLGERPVAAAGLLLVGVAWLPSLLDRRAAA